jgi:hypothetical protein
VFANPVARIPLIRYVKGERRHRENPEARERLRVCQDTVEGHAEVHVTSGILLAFSVLSIPAMIRWAKVDINIKKDHMWRRIRPSLSVT